MSCIFKPEVDICLLLMPSSFLNSPVCTFCQILEQLQAKVNLYSKGNPSFGLKIKGDLFIPPVYFYFILSFPRIYSYYYIQERRIEENAKVLVQSIICIVM